MLTMTVCIARSHRRRPVLQAQTCFGHGNSCLWKQHRRGLPTDHVLETDSQDRLRMGNACWRTDPANLLCDRHIHLPACTAQDEARVAEAPSRLPGFSRHPLCLPLCWSSHRKSWGLCSLLLHRYVLVLCELEQHWVLTRESRVLLCHSRCQRGALRLLVTTHKCCKPPWSNNVCQSYV